MSSKKVNVNGIDIYCEKIGKGPNILLCLPGGLGPSRIDYAKQIEDFDRYDFTLVLWDAPGFGNSRPPERNYHKDVFTEDAKLAHELMKVLKYDTFSVMGWSDGAKTGLIMAFLFPDSVKKLVVFGPIMYGTPQIWFILNLTKDICTWSEKRRKDYQKVYGSQLQELWTHHLDSMQKANVIPSRNPHEKEISSIKCPVFILHGDLDPVCPVEQMNYLHRLIPHAKVYRFPKGSHDIHMAFYETFNELVQEFLID